MKLSRKLDVRRKGSPYLRRTENYEDNVFIISVKQEKITHIYRNTCIYIFLHTVLTSNAVKKKPYHCHFVAWLKISGKLTTFSVFPKYITYHFYIQRFFKRLDISAQSQLRN